MAKNYSSFGSPAGYCVPTESALSPDILLLRKRDRDQLISERILLIVLLVASRHAWKVWHWFHNLSQRISVV